MRLLVRRSFTLEQRRVTLDVRVAAREVGTLALAALGPAVLSVVMAARSRFVTFGGHAVHVRSPVSVPRLLVCIVSSVVGGGSVLVEPKRQLVRIRERFGQSPRAGLLVGVAVDDQ